MRHLLRSITVFATATVTVAAMATLGAGPAHAAMSGQIQFTTRGTYQWTAPAGVDAGEIVLRGAAGGTQHAADGTSAPGGNGGLVQAELPLNAGDTYTILVGGAGGDAADSASVDASGGAGGYGFGGEGDGVLAAGCHPSGGGGGETAFYDGVQMTTPLVVAGGGGGARVAAPGGAGDYPNGDAGISSDPNHAAAAGGTQTHGGPPGVGSDGGYDFALPGSYQAGGRGGNDGCDAGGGGGGGYYGGGGGSGLGGGGGGSSYVTPAADIYNATTSSLGGSGSFTLVYGTADAPAPVVAPPLEITAGQPTATHYAASGWPQPLFVASGSVPPGLTMDTAGVLRGTPTTPGTYAVTVNAYNEAGITAWTEEVDVAVATPAGVTLSPNTDTAPVGGMFAHDPVAHVTDADGNAVVGCAVLFADHDGLVSFASASPQSPQSITVTTDADGNADPGAVVAGNTRGTALITANCGTRDATASYTVTGIGPAFARPFPPAAQVGHRFSYTYRTEGTPQPTVRVVSGTVPTGMKLARTGALTGTPTAAGSFTFTMKATNGFGTPAELTQTIAVAPASLLRVASTSAKEGNAGGHTRRITVSLSAPAVAAVTVHWSTSDGTATAGSDYVAASGTIRIAAGQTSATITVTILGDTVVEPDETFSVLLSDAKNATIATARAIQTIVSDDHA